MEKDIDLLAIGELNPDLVFTGLGSMPIPGREVLAESYVLTLGSSTAICAAAAAGLGLKTYLVSKVGCDPFGLESIRLLRQTGVRTDFVEQDPKVRTGITVSMADAHDRALMTSLEVIAQFGAEDVNTDLFKRARHIHVGSFFLQTHLREGLAELFRTAKQQGITTSLDAGWDDSGCWDYGLKEVLRHTEFFFPNEVEAARITGTSDPVEAAKILSQTVGCAVVKCGADGAVLCRDGMLLHRKAIPGMPVVDTTGAGDSFNAGFLYGLLRGKPLAQCLDYATACAAISITRVGGASSLASAEALEALLRQEKSTCT